MRAHKAEITAKEHKTDHVIIIGFGVNGKNLALVLKELEVPYVILELNGQTVSEWRRKGEPIFYGDATSNEILHKAGIDQARAAVISITDPSATRQVVKKIRTMNRTIYIVVKTAYLAEVEDLIATGADEVIPAEFETSIELFSRILHFYHMPKALIGQYAERFRKDQYKMFIKGETPKRLFHDTIAVMPNVDYESYVVEKGSAAVNASIKELNIQSRTGALVIAVKRGGKTMQGLLANTVFQAEDIVFLIGERDALGKARELFKA